MNYSVLNIFFFPFERFFCDHHRSFDNCFGDFTSRHFLDLLQVWLAFYVEESALSSRPVVSGKLLLLEVKVIYFGSNLFPGGTLSSFAFLMSRD